VRTVTLLLVVWLLFSCGKVNQLASYNYEDESNNYGDVHKNVRELDGHLSFNALNDPSEKNVHKLTDELIKDMSSTQEKARVIHDWIVINIFYDFTRYVAPGNLYRPYFYLEVLRSRLTMCGGYTDLFFVMAKMAGLRVAAVTGDIANNHIWNAVWDGAMWRHVDATWDSGNFYNGKRSPRFSTTYFFLTTEQMATETENHNQDSGVYHYSETAAPYSGY